VRAFAVDGTTADGWVREVDGVGRPENGGLTVHDAPTTAGGDSWQATPTIDTPTTTLVSPRGKPVTGGGSGAGGGAPHKGGGGAHPSGSGTVRDGFTKLK
jgi:hypothetical protein